MKSQENVLIKTETKCNASKDNKEYGNEFYSLPYCYSSDFSCALISAEDKL